MIQYSLRLFKRFVVLVPGIIIAYLSVRDIFPYFDSRLPLSLAIFVTYVLGAYVLIPAIIRFIRVVRPPEHLPHYCVTPDGFASDPLNIGIVGNRHQLIMAMQQAGWHIADPHRLLYVLRFIVSSFLRQPYPNAPVSSLYLFGRKQDLASTKPLGDSLVHRHHVRFWATTYRPGHELSARSIHWQGRQARLNQDDLLWVGAASLDAGVAFIRHNLQLSHMINPDTNVERELIVSQLKAAKLLGKTETLTLGRPYRLVNRVWRGYLNADGLMRILHLQARP